MKKIWMAALVFLAGMAAGRFAFAAEGYSADMVMHTGGQDLQAKVYYSAQKMRVELAGTIMITRIDQKVTWVIMPAQNIYMEQAADPKAVLTASKEVPGEIERVSVGKETVNGVEAEKFKITYKETGGQTQTLYQWIAAGALVPVRIAAADDSWVVDYTNVTPGDQPDSLFEVPEGYQKLTMPSIADIGAIQE